MRKHLLVIILSIMPSYLLAAAPIINLVTPVSYFVNHVKQLNLLKSNLSKYKKVSIVGTSGIGKTQLARTYAYEHQQQYDLIWFIDCNLDFNQEFVRLAQQINKTVHTKLPEEAVHAQKAVIDYLTHQQQWLLVLDNLKVNQNKLVRSLVDWEHNGQVIFCSQDNEGLPHTIEMTKFNQADTFTLAKNVLEGHSQEDIDFLIKGFEGYPILTVQGAQLLNKIKGLNRTEYKHKIYQAADKIKANITLAIKELKPNAVKLLSKLALLNNQKFSKQLIILITDSPATIDDDIYQLSKFMLIVNVNTNSNDSFFEMHDIIAQKVLEINQSSNKLLLEEMMSKINDHYNQLGKSTHTKHIMSVISTIMPANLEIILRNAEKYRVNIYAEMHLRRHLLVRYGNDLDKYGCEQMIDWFNEQEKHKKFSMLWTNKLDQRGYAAYLGLIGVYNRNILAHFKSAVSYLTRALEILEKMDENYVIGWKYNHLSHLAAMQAFLGNITEAKIALNKLEQLFARSTDKSDITLLYHAKTAICQMQGQYLEALENSDKSIKEAIKCGMLPNDLFMTIRYKMKAESLNWSGQYQQAAMQAQQLYDMHRQVKRVDHPIFGSIYVQMARSTLGLGKIKLASEQIKQAIVILLADERRNPKNVSVSQDPDLANAYLVQGEILAAQGDLKTAIESYRQAQAIYFYLYKENRQNVAHVSYLYVQGAKAACKAKDLYHYRCFSQPQIKEFGINHPGTAQMLQYCQQYNMSLSQLDK